MNEKHNNFRDFMFLRSEISSVKDSLTKVVNSIIYQVAENCKEQVKVQEDTRNKLGTIDHQLLVLRNDLRIVRTDIDSTFSKLKRAGTLRLKRSKQIRKIKDPSRRLNKVLECERMQRR